MGLTGRGSSLKELWENLNEGVGSCLRQSPSFSPPSTVMPWSGSAVLMMRVTDFVSPCGWVAGWLPEWEFMGFLKAMISPISIIWCQTGKHIHSQYCMHGNVVMLDSFEFLVFGPSFLMCCLLCSSVKEFLKCVFSLLLFKFFLEMLFFCHTDTDSNLLINHSFLKDFFKSHLLYVYVEKMRVYALYTVISGISYNWFKLFMQGQKTGYAKSKILYLPEVSDDEEFLACVRKFSGKSDT